MMLGDLLARARDGTGSFQAWLETADPELAAAVESAAAVEAMTPTSYVRAAIADFSRFASEEDWATLTSTLRRNSDPGMSCLLAMVDWRLTVSACPGHSHQANPEGVGADERSDRKPA